jgi:hypothetical protein
MADKYLELVQNTARKMDKEFFLDSGEGHDLGDPDDEWYVERLSGWLVDKEDAANFERLLKREGKLAAWRSSYQYCFVLWTLVDNPQPREAPVSIRFEPTTYDAKRVR